MCIRAIIAFTHLKAAPISRLLMHFGKSPKNKNG